MNSHLNKVFHADCVDFLPQLAAESINFVLTDPPYLVGYKSRDGRALANDSGDAWLRPAFREIYRVLQADAYCVSFYGWPHCDKFMQAWREAGFRPVGHLVFPKRYTSSIGNVRCQHEAAYLLAKGSPTARYAVGDVLDWNDYTGNKLHPTQKPTSILLPLIENYSHPDGTILDPFAGSGSALEAARMLGRKWLGIELDAKYHAIASKRLGCEKSQDA
jgi:DNA modification methylase